AYQWGLHGQSGFLVDKKVVSENYTCIEYDINESRKFLQDDFDNTYGRIISDDTYIKELDNLSISYEEAENLYNTVKRKKDIVIAIIDSGVDIYHPELLDSIWTNKYEIPGNGVDDDGNGYIDDVHGYNFYDNTASVYTDINDDIHGTHSAGIIVGKHDNGGIRGIAYNEHIKIMPIKILGANGSGKVSNFIKAVEYAEKNGASICNVSLGAFTYRKELDDIIRKSNMLFVVAAGNGENYHGYNIDENSVFPASFSHDNVLTVGNLCFDGTLYSSSNYGNSVSVAAPGTMILSTIPEGKYGFITGTSMAAPFVTAVCAMTMSISDKINAHNIKSIIECSVDRLDSLYGKVKTSGVINAYKAMQLATLY
ncbi:MAG: S8 family serine peptidase, partial [Lachnospiraceae bacterium]|nr:S8 family serine peptidase [Lachnospiraceae bacterium]